MGDEELLKPEQIAGKGGGDPSVRSKSDSSHKKRAETTKRNATPDPLASTPTHTVFVGCRDNNGSSWSRDRILKTLTASCYVMNVWLPLSQRHTNMVLPTSPALRQNRAMCPTETESCAWNLLFLFISMQLATCKHILQNQVSFFVKSVRSVFCSVSSSNGRILFINNYIVIYSKVILVNNIN